MTRLTAKTQSELDLLEDIRSYIKARAAIEADYASSISKLTTQLLQKKKWPTPPKMPLDLSRTAK
jgi:hypothetical protein